MTTAGRSSASVAAKRTSPRLRARRRFDQLPSARSDELIDGIEAEIDEVAAAFGESFQERIDVSEAWERRFERIARRAVKFRIRRIEKRSGRRRRLADEQHAYALGTKAAAKPLARGAGHVA